LIAVEIQPMGPFLSILDIIAFLFKFSKFAKAFILNFQASHFIVKLFTKLFLVLFHFILKCNFAPTFPQLKSQQSFLSIIYFIHSAIKYSIPFRVAAVKKYQSAIVNTISRVAVFAKNVVFDRQSSNFLG